ncbi:MAG TPA: hypothetical protein VFG64_00700 [Dongiaceae bacterium]|nr:hypothetical protein [Dongiaceae bacterium]
MSRYTLAFCAIAAMAPAMPATAQENGSATAPAYVGAPVAQPISQRFVLIVLDQADRDLTKGDPRINMMFDTQTGRSWILEYSRKPDSNEQGYVWVEVPYAKPPTN